jgi:hypothetical protein
VSDSDVSPEVFGSWTAPLARKLWGSGAYACLAAGFVVCTILIAPLDFPAGALFAVLFAPFAAMLAWAAWRVPSSRVVINVDEVQVSGPLRTRRIPISEAREFRAVVAGGDQPTVVLVTNRQRTITLWVFNREGFRWQFQRLEHDLEPVAAALNAALEAARGAT